jgi:hypothetical protein
MLTFLFNFSVIDGISGSLIILCLISGSGYDIFFGIGKFGIDCMILLYKIQ